MDPLLTRKQNSRLPPEVNRILYIRNLPYKITVEEMYDIFGKYGPIRQIRLGDKQETRGDHSAFDFFRQETSHPDVSIRVTAMNRVIVIMALMGPEKLLKELHPTNRAQIDAFYELFKRISTDDNSDLFYSRISACHIVSDIYRLVPTNEQTFIKEVVSEVIPLIRNFFDEPSWKIRLSISRNFGDLCDCLEASYITNDIYSGTIHFLQDMEPEIRVNMIKSMSSFLKVLGTKAFMNEFVPVTTLLLTDPVYDVRKEFAELLVNISTFLSIEEVNTYVIGIEFFLTNFLQNYITLLKDDVMEVRLSCGDVIS
eukprot:gene19656-25571_t